MKRLVLSAVLMLCSAVAHAGEPALWVSRAPGFETSEVGLDVFSLNLAKLYLERIDPAKWNFRVKTDPSGAHDLRDWMAETGATLVVNGSYYAPNKQPVTPVSSDGKLVAPKRYVTRNGAFLASNKSAAVVNLRGLSWQQAFAGRSNALVSFPLLMVNGVAVKLGGSTRPANRSFIAQDKAGRIVIGTTSLAPVSLQDFATLLAGLKLDLVTAVNLDGGPLACQSLQTATLKREVCDSELLPVDFSGNTYVQKLPVVIAVTPN